MTLSRLASTALAISALTTISAPVEAGQRAGVSGQVVGRAVPRAAPPAVARPPFVVAPRIGFGPFRPYYYPYRYPYRLGLSVGFYAGYPYPYYPYGYYPYAYYPYGYGYTPYGYAAGYVTAVPGVGYGGVRIQGAPGDAQVFADGYYVGVVSDFDGAFKQLNLAPGAHQIEIRAAGRPPQQFDVRIEPGQTITYRAR
jgi:hypothetical protein